MSEKPNYGGYEWSIECPCGETMAANGMERGKRDDEWLHNRRSEEIPRTDGDTIECENCGSVWELNFREQSE